MKHTGSEENHTVVLFKGNFIKPFVICNITNDILFQPAAGNVFFTAGDDIRKIHIDPLVRFIPDLPSQTGQTRAEFNDCSFRMLFQIFPDLPCKIILTYRPCERTAFKVV